MEQIKQKIPINSRNKGNVFERQIVNKFKEKYPLAMRSSYAAKYLDDNKIDIANIPYNVQAKNGYSTIDYKKILTELQFYSSKMEDRKSFPNILIHKLDKRKAKKSHDKFLSEIKLKTKENLLLIKQISKETDTLVIMNLKTFLNLIL